MLDPKEVIVKEYRPEDAYPPAMPKIADRLKDAKEAHDAKLVQRGGKPDTIAGLARIAGIKKQTMHNWFNGVVERVDPEAVERLADYWSVSFFTLLTGKAEPSQGLDAQALEKAYMALDVYGSELGASLPQDKRVRLLKRFYSLATIDRLDRTVAEALILDAVRSPLPE